MLTAHNGRVRLEHLTKKFFWTTLTRTHIFNTESAREMTTMNRTTRFPLNNSSQYIIIRFVAYLPVTIMSIE